MNRSLVILLHGVGSNGADLAPLGAAWAQTFPTLDFASPDGPFAFGPGAGRQWFSIDGVTGQNRPARVAAARTAFDGVLTRIIAEHGLSSHLDRVALVGFSQGSIMALDTLASGRWPLGAIVAFSGRLASPVPLTPARGTPVLLIHGAADPVIPAHETTEAASALSGLGAVVQSTILPGVGHTITNEGVALAGRFLGEILKL